VVRYVRGRVPLRIRKADLCCILGCTVFNNGLVLKVGWKWCFKQEFKEFLKKNLVLTGKEGGE